MKALLCGGFVLAKVSFWLYEDVWRLLRKATRRCGVARNRVVNLAVMDFLRSGVDERFGDVKLEMEAAALIREANRLVRLQSAILRHGPYLRGYVDVLVRGGKLREEHRRGLAEYPGGVAAVDALERIFGRRQAISRRLAEIAVELLPDERYEMPRRLKVDVEPALKKGWPLCPELVNWANKQFKGLPDRQYCSKFSRFVKQPACWQHWNRGYDKEVFLEFVKLGRLAGPGASRSPVTETAERR